MSESNDVLLKAKEHFTDLVENGLKSVKVPEWDVKIFWRPMSLKTQNRIYKYVRDGSLEAMVETIITRSLDEDGKRLFKSIHKTEMMTMVDPSVITRIVNFMNGEDEDNLEEVVKNSD